MATHVSQGRISERIRAVAPVILLGALVLGILPSFLAVDAPHALRSFDAATFVMVIAALG